MASERRWGRRWRTPSAWLRLSSSSEPSLRYRTPLSCSGTDLHRWGRPAAPPWYTSRVSLVSVSTAQSSTEGSQGGGSAGPEHEEEEEEDGGGWGRGREREEEEEQLDMEGPQVSMRLEGDTEAASHSGSTPSGWIWEGTPRDDWCAARVSVFSPFWNLWATLSTAWSAASSGCSSAGLLPSINTSACFELTPHWPLLCPSR